MKVTTFTRARGETMSTLSPTHMHQPGVVSTRLTRNEPNKATKKMAQSPEEAMKKLTPVPNLLPHTNRKPRKNQGSTGTEMGANSFFSMQPMTNIGFKHQQQFEIRNAKFAQISITLRPMQ